MLLKIITSRILAFFLTKIAISNFLTNFDFFDKVCLFFKYFLIKLPIFSNFLSFFELSTLGVKESPLGLSLIIYYCTVLSGNGVAFNILTSQILLFLISLCKVF